MASLLRKVLVFTVAAVFALFGGLASATSEDSGAVALVDPRDPSIRYHRGDSTTAFSLALPAGASCPGDSANDGWRIQSFIVPIGTDVSTMRFQALRPDTDQPATHRSLRLVDGSIFTQQMTAENSVVGEPGLILPVPALTFAHFESGTLPAGRYTIGIACTLVDGQVRRYWDTTVAFETDSEVVPGGMRWEVVAADDAFVVSSEADPRLAAWPTIVAVAALVAAFAAIWFTRSGRSRSSRGSLSPQGESS